MKSRAYLLISASLFAVVATLHLIRVLYAWEVQVADWTIPMWVSWLGFFGPGALSAWAFILIRRKRE